MPHSAAIGTFVAALLGPMMLAIALAIFLNRATFKTMMKDAAADHGLIFIAGIIAILAGATIIKLHNVWVMDWPVIVTLAGWLSLAAGFFRMIWPNLAAGLARQVMEHDTAINVMALVSGVLGAVLVYIGFF